jgi:hypothetical protein
MDKDNLHGSILGGMAQGIKNSYLVLICYNEQYSKSRYCQQGYISNLFDFINNINYCLEATYTFENRIDFIPCRLQDSYRPDDWLGMIISNNLYIDFSSPNDFDHSFKKLIDEIEYFKSQSQTHSSKSLFFFC